MRRMKRSPKLAIEALIALICAMSMPTRKPGWSANAGIDGVRMVNSCVFIAARIVGIHARVHN